MAKTTVNDRVYYEDGRGALIPAQNVKAVDILRDETVEDMITEAKSLNKIMLEFKDRVSKKINEFVDISAGEYGETWGGSKGNMKLRTFDGRYLVQISQQEQLDFNEHLQIAEKLIEECITERATNADPLLLTMVKAAFTRDHNGTVNIRSVLKLQKYDIDDPKWKKAMKAISNSIETTGSKEYIRFYERRGKDQKMVSISLDLACL